MSDKNEKLISPEDIMTGRIPTSTRIFDVPLVGRIKLHRLPAKLEAEAARKFNDPKAVPEKLAKLAERNTFYMIHGYFDDEQAAKLPDLMDQEQLAYIHVTGLFFTKATQAHLESIEKNSESNPN